MNKTYNLNSSQELNWQLYFGLQDENAPSSPDDLLKGSFQIIPAIVPGNVEIDLDIPKNKPMQPLLKPTQ